MKTRRNLMLFVGLLAFFVLSACATTATETIPPAVDTIPPAVDTIPPAVNTNVVVTEAPEVTDLSSFTDQEMMDFIEGKSRGNHTIEFILDHDFTREEWSVTIDRMISYGADIDPIEKEAIIEWLLNR
ncbi:MAG: hypothetical protein GX603_07320 [Chloroflexi bacterium]|nr:hypothetical protein [Chloroflexota bacterium]